MKKFCLTPNQVLKFKEALKLGITDPNARGALNPGKISNLSSKERRKILEDIVGKENALQVNALFESKLLLKNQKAGMIRWVKKTAGLDKKRQDELVAKVEKLNKALDPEEEKLFLEDFVSTKLGTNITTNEAKKILELSEAITPYKGLLDEFGLPTKEYMEKTYDLYKYLEDITPGSPVTAGRVASEIVGTPRALMTMADFSASLRQGGFLFAKHPVISTGAFLKQFRAGFSEKNYQELLKNIKTDPFYPLAEKSGLAISELGGNLMKREEAYMANWIERVPLLGSLARGSARAYTAFLDKQRFDVFKSMVKNAQRVGRNPVDDEALLKNISNFVNTATGRGGLGRFERSANDLSVALFSPRLLSSRLSLLNPIYYYKLDPFVRKEALKSLFAFASTGSMVLALAKMRGAEVEIDPRSADFGKIKIGRTRHDIWGGFQQYIRLAAQLYTNQIKSTNTKIITNLGDGYGSRTRADVAGDFLTNKSAPVPSYIINWMKGTNFEGEPFDPKDEAIQRSYPIIAQDIYDLIKQGDIDSIPYQIEALLGIGVQTYEKNPNVARWSQSTSQEMQAFKKSVGDNKFKEAESKFNLRYNQWLEDTTKKPEYTALPNEEKKDLISKSKTKIKKEVFEEYSFKHKKTAKEENDDLSTMLP